MFYIRFLSPPKVSEGSKTTFTVTAVVAVTTDLGDHFLADDLALKARLLDASNPEKVFKSSDFTWHGQSRALKLALQCPGKYTLRDIRMHVTTVATEGDLNHRLVPSIIDVWSARFSLTDKQRAEPFVERRLVLSNGSILRIEEETGDSIARHVWDASLGFLHFFGLALDRGATDFEFQQLISRKGERPLRVIELGAGCGIVGIAFAQLVKSEVLLTDLNDAADIIGRNIRLATLAAGSSLKLKVLDWCEDLDSVDTPFDVVLVSDCIYNPDSSVFLVQTLRKLAQKTPSPLILVGYKHRHSADQVFFDSMRKAQFVTSSTSSIHISRRKGDYEDAVPPIQFYQYRLSTCGEP